MIFYNQVVPGSVLMGYLNADHWAVAVPINRAHAMVASMFVTQNAYRGGSSRSGLTLRGGGFGGAQRPGWLRQIGVLDDRVKQK